jgi:acid phosphatase (class A)
MDPGKNAQGFMIGYLAAAPDMDQILAPPPPLGSALQQGELAAVRALRAPKDPALWALAVADDTIDPWATFEGALGAKIDKAKAPQASIVLQRVGTDIVSAYDPAKEHFARPRPFVSDPTIEICVTDAKKRERLTKSPSYPSGHAGFGWGHALVLAAMVPEKTDAILARGRAYGDSRMVCGVHYPSDIAAGRMTAAAVLARLESDPAYHRDFLLAKTELRAALGLK